MQQYTVIKDIVIILLVSLPVVYLFKKVNLPGIVGFLIAGMIIGPYGFRLIPGDEHIGVMAEVGVILLLFNIGLEVSFSRLVKMKKLLIYAGGSQVISVVAITAIASQAFGIPLSTGIFLGMLISLSSTAIVLTLFAERSELESPQGKISLGILIFQDLAIVPMFIFLPILGSKEELSFVHIILQLLYAFGLLALIIVIARFIMPKILYRLARLRAREAFTIGILLLLLGTAYLTHAMGLSFALGAFIAGIILSESDYSHQVVAEILPLKDAFNSIFFVSVGLLLNIEFVLHNPLLILAVVAGTILFKTVVVVIIVKLLRYPLRTAILTGIALAQIGEFSFVLVQSGMNYHLLSPGYYNAFLAASIFTMLLTPFLLQLSPLIAGKMKNMESSPASEKQNIKGHVIIAGFGLNGKNLARVLKETGIPYIILEMNPDTVKHGKEKGENIIFGDITKEEILTHAGINDANIIVFAISDPHSARIGLKIAKKYNPDIYAIIRTRYINEIDDLMQLGADEVIPEEFETSLQIFSKVLEKYHIPLNVIMKQVSLLRGESYSMMIKEMDGANSFININEILAAGLTETYYIVDTNIHIGKSLIELDLRAKTGVTIIAIVRDNETLTNPAGEETIKAKDTFVITGTHAAVDKAYNYLNSLQS